MTHSEQNPATIGTSCQATFCCKKTPIFLHPAVFAGMVSRNPFPPGVGSAGGNKTALKPAAQFVRHTNFHCS